MKAKAEIEDTKNLYDYWGERLYRSVLDDSRIIINLLRSIINNNEKEGCQVCDITDDLLFLQNKKCTNCREMNTMRGLSRKLYLDLSVPTEEDQRSDQQRILEALSAEGVKEEVHIPVRMLRQLYPLLDRAGWKITVSLSWNGEKWELVDIESGDTARQHYGLAVDLGSTTVVVRLLDCNSGEILGEESCFNKQIQWGTDILSRIFFCKDDRKKLEEIRLATVESIIECMDKLDVKHPVSRKCLSMVVAGNTTMIHFLLGIDAFCVFYTPHAVHADRPGFQPAKDLDIPLNGYVYCYPAKSNYLGGDIISGMIETELYIFCRSMKSDSDEWKRTEEFVIKSKDKLFDSFCVEVFFNAFSDEKIHMIDNETLDTMLWKKVPRIKLELNFAQIKAIADLFAHIVDYKSPFTSNHSMGVAEGAEKISRFMGFDKDICQKMYIAGALHDIGKVAIGNEILEKPEKLTDEEFKTMKHHAVL